MQVEFGPPMWLTRTHMHTHQGSFRDGTHENAVPMVEKLPEHMGTAFPLLEWLRVHYGRHCEPFSGQKCTRLQDFAYTISEIFLGVMPPNLRSAMDFGRTICARGTSMSIGSDLMWYQKWAYGEFTKRPLTHVSHTSYWGSIVGFEDKCIKSLCFYVFYPVWTVFVLVHGCKCPLHIIVSAIWLSLTNHWNCWF